MAFPLLLRTAEVHALQQPEEVAGREQRPDDTDRHEDAVSVVMSASASAGLYAPTSDRNSPQNPARPGRPSEAIDEYASSPASHGIISAMPPRRAISRVWNRS